MNRLARIAMTVWLLALAACLAIIWQSEFTADMSAFLPQRPSASQQLLVDQLRAGNLSRLLLIGIEGGDAASRAGLSKALSARLSASGEFTAVQNGDAAALAKDREILLAYRYLLSPAVNAERFSVAGLRQAIGDSIDLLASPAGLMAKNLLPRDPTGEMMELLGSLDAGNGPASDHGVWASRDGRRAVLMAQTATAGSDTDGQQRALARLHADFAAVAGGADARLLVSGAPVFAVTARSTIKGEVERLAIISAVGIITVLLLAYRSVTALALGLLPVLSGALAGIAAVSLGFGSVHGLTVGFGTTLIGEAVDYSIYYFVQSQEGTDADWRVRFWPTIRLGVLTSLCGFGSLLFSGFPGLAQLGLYSMSGLIVAAAVTRFVLPQLRPQGFRLRDTTALGRAAGLLLSDLGRLRWAALVLAAAALAVLVAQRDQLWNTRLSDLSPMPPAQMALDQSLRAELGAQDQGYLVVVSAPEREAALDAAEHVAGRLQALVDHDVISGFETPTRFLPSAATQKARQAALPARAELAARLKEALIGLPLRPERLLPFLDDVEAARSQPLLTADRLKGSTLALAVDAMLQQRSSGWSVLMPLRGPATGEFDTQAVKAALGKSGDAVFLDLGEESGRLYANYLDEAIWLSLAGFVAIAVLLGATLRSAPRLARVLAPLALAVLLVMAGLALAGERLTLLHLVGLLLTVAVGSNYALFFDGGNAVGEPRTLTSLIVANATTVIGFGALATSTVPVLHAIGVTVGPGAVLALLFSAMLAGRAH
ncbi:MAG TPA: MMPL family transporter [Rhodocyclaceae bacterium]|nr:MMPL family transporter [Rhodocyclaceae bacterium]